MDTSQYHYNDVIMDTIASQITSPTIDYYSAIYSGADHENIRAPRHWRFCGNSSGIGEFPAQMASNAESVSIWWRHHEHAVDRHLHDRAGPRCVRCMCATYKCVVPGVDQGPGLLRKILFHLHMMTSSNGNIFRVTGHLCREFTGKRWIPRTKASDAEL